MNVTLKLYYQLNNSGPGDYCDEDETGPGYPSPDWKGSGWYRVTGEAGTRIPEKSPGIEHCGTYAVGWMRGVHPSTPGDQVVATVCFDVGFAGDCFVSANTTVINCGDFFLYDLPEKPYCYYRYCGSVV